MLPQFSQPISKKNHQKKAENIQNMSFCIKFCRPFYNDITLFRMILTLLSYANSSFTACASKVTCFL